MSGLAVFFMTLGVATATAGLFRVLDWIERPARKTREE